MKLPKTVKVLSKTYTVDVVEPTLGVLAMEGVPSVYGLQRARNCSILINKMMHPDQQRDTLIHELLHAYDFDMKIGLSEKQTHRLASCILSMLKDNPKVVEFLTEK